TARGSKRTTVPAPAVAAAVDDNAPVPDANDPFGQQASAPPASVAAHPPPPAVATPAPRPDELAAALAEYRAATALENTDPTAAVRAWQTWRAKRSSSALAHGADLRLLALLRALHRDDEAAALAREFLRRYPSSPRRADVERIIERPR